MKFYLDHIQLSFVFLQLTFTFNSSPGQNLPCASLGKETTAQHPVFVQKPLGNHQTSSRSISYQPAPS